MEELIFTMEDGEQVTFYVIEETRINGVNYLCVTDSDNEEEDANAYIMKDVSSAEETEAVYEIVEDDAELESVSKIFEQLLEDVELQ